MMGDYGELYEKLSRYAASGAVPMHVPGHKRNVGLLGARLPYGIDVTELPGFDSLHDMRGILLGVAERAAALYGSERAFPLVNGSTGGLLAAVRALTSRGDAVVMARNCHMSVYSAVEMNGLDPVVITPGYDALSGIPCSVNPGAVADAIDKCPGCALVIITSPTYEGVVSDVRAISEATRSRSVPLLVDAAHGAHLGFSDFFPESAIREGADVVVSSLHKTLPALTQCALALTRGPLSRPGDLARELAVFQTSSPSYVLLASIDACISLLGTRRADLFGAFEDNLRHFDERIAGLGALRAICHGGDLAGGHGGFYGYDPGKIVVSARGLGASGAALAEALRSGYGIETEMSASDYVVAVATVCDVRSSFDAFAEALISIDRSPGALAGVPRYVKSPPSPSAPPGFGLIPLAEAEGATALEHVWAYPPGTPIIVSGEAISALALREIRRLMAEGAALKTSSGSPPGFIAARRDKWIY
ncbi:MAG: DegT/DnrJ/EryC1/StrS family aminotransferase [Oscillospiraceae bacterium]|jgi:arginine/lysine/ornithine decarboxylase|nr:DegT/DnrJ/EryC1/StrS family aminotransferase [Oscillospiraceae bacterium]